MDGSLPPRKKTGDNTVRLFKLSDRAILPVGPVVMKPGTGPVPDGVDDTPARLQLLRRQFDAAAQRDVGADHQKRVDELRERYIAALDRAIADAANAVKLDEAISLKKIQEALASGKNPKIDKATPAQAKVMLNAYDQQLAALVQLLRTRMKPLYDRYDAALGAYMAELSKAQRLDDALRVKKEREILARERTSATVR